VFAPAHIAGTIDQIMAGQRAETDHTAGQAALARIEDARGKMARYRVALDAGGDPEEMGKWIAEAKAQRLAAEAEMHQATPGTATVTRQQIQAVIEERADTAQNLRDASPADLASAHRRLSLRLTYYPARKLVQATMSPKPESLSNW
jgi:site-specific DNA recombinase